MNYRDNNNLVLVAAVDLASGCSRWCPRASGREFPEWWVTIFDSGISSASIMAVVLNIFFNMWRPGRPEQPTSIAAGPPVMVREQEIAH